MPSPVYDDQKSKNDTHHPRSGSSGGEFRPRSASQHAPGSGERSHHRPSGGSKAHNTDQDTDPNPDDIANRESSGAHQEASKAEAKESDSLSDQVGKGYTGEESERKLSVRGGGKKKNRNRLLGYGLIGSLVGSFIAMMFTILPFLRLDSYLSKINERAMAATSQAVEARLGHLFERYMINHLLDMERCGNVVSNDCRAPISDSGLVSGLFRSWRDIGIEQKLFDKYGLSVESHRSPDPSTGNHRFTLTDRFGRQITLTDGDLRSGRFTGGSRELGREMRAFVRSETRWYQVLERRSIRRYLHHKHGVRLWCFWACNTKDDNELRRHDLSNRFKYFFTRRFVYPFSQKMGIIMDCLTSGGGNRCSAENLRKQSIDRDPDPEFTNRIRQKIDNPDGPRKSFVQLVLEELIEKIVVRESTRASLRTAVSSIPLVGQVYMAVVFTDMFDRLDDFVENNGFSRVAADLNLRQYLEWYSAMRSTNDEMKKGEATMEEVGKVMEQLDGAEESLLYQVNYNSPGEEIRRDPDYRCASGRPIPEDEFVCPEKSLKRTFLIEDIRDNRVVDGLAEVLNSYGRCIGAEIFGRCPQGEPRKYIRPILEGIDWVGANTVGHIVGLASSGLRLVPGVGSFIDRVEDLGTRVIEAFFNKVFPLPVNLDSPGRDLYDGLEAGGAISASEFGKGGKTDEGEYYGLGAPQLSDEEAIAIYEEFFEQKQYAYQQKGLFEKLTDVSYSGSFMNHVLAAIPTKLNEIPNNIAVSLPQMFGKFANMLTGLRSVSAQAAVSQLTVNKAFGVTMYGYPRGSDAFTRDPSELTEEFCREQEEARKQSMEEDEVTGFDEYTVADPCQLERIVAEAGSLFFIDEEESGLGGSGGGRDSTAPEGQLGGDAQENARAIINNDNVTGSSVYMSQIQAIADGNSSCNVNPTILSLINTIGNNHEIYITSLNRQCTGVLTASGARSYHYRDGGGHAVDLGTVDGVSSTGNTANDRALLNEILPLLPSGSGIGQSNCRTNNPITMPAGVRQFSDSCNHIHIQVPVQ